MGTRTSPFLKKVCEELGVPEDQAAGRWVETRDRVARLRGRPPEDMDADDLEEAAELLKSELLQEAARSTMSPEDFIESELDARAFIETTFVQSSPEGQEVYDDGGKAKLLTRPAAGFKAAGLMAPGGSVGESTEDEGPPAEAPTEDHAEEDPVGPDLGGVFDDEALAENARRAAESVLRSSTR